MEKSKLSRRRFLGEASCLAIGSTTLYSSILNLGVASALAGAGDAGDDYKALVCILLSGGNDSYNMLLPRDNASYAEYAATRSNLAIAQNDMLAINPLSSGGMEFGLHPSMPELRDLFEQGDAALIANIGTLVEPLTQSQFFNGGVSIPLGLLSHSDQAMQWQTSFPQERSSRGWGGKMADILMSGNQNDTISMNVSLSGKNVFQTGQMATEYSINADVGSVGIFGYGEPDIFNQLATNGVNNLLNQQYQNVFKKTYADVIKNAVESNEQFNEAITAVPDFNTQFSDNYVAGSLQMIARTIAARDTLGMKRQTFFLSFGGWDHHDELISNQSDMLGMLSKALSEFNSALNEINMNECVTTFTISDFARTLTSNGNGTDHAWGGNAIVMGGSVKGQQVYGDYPSLALNGDLQLGNGIILPTTSTDEYFGELALWFGVSKSELTDILPNIGNFYSISSPDTPLGFMES